MVFKKMVIWHPKKCSQGHEFFWGITNSPQKEFYPMVYTSLPYHRNVFSSKTISGVIFIQYFIFQNNFWYLTCSDLEEILHGIGAWCEVPPIKIFSKSVNIKGSNYIIFSQLY